MLDRVVYVNLDKEVKMLPFYLVTIGEKKNQNLRKRERGYITNQILWCTSGCGNLIIKGKKYMIKEGDGVFIAANVAHEYYAECSPWSTRWIAFDGGAIEYISGFLADKDFALFKTENIVGIDGIFDQMYLEASRKNSYYEIFCSSKIYNVLYEIIKVCGRETNRDRHKFEDVILYIDKNYYEQITLEKMGEIAQLSPDYFGTLFKEKYSYTPIQYLNMVRIRKAKLILIEKKDVPIKNVSVEVGFNEPSYFCMVFKKLEGMSPNEYRRSNLKQSYRMIRGEEL